MDKVSIIIPYFNKKKFINKTIKSILNQTYKKSHLFIIDDFSSDNSLEIIEKFKSLESLTIIKLKKNKGPSFCRNYAMRLSKAKYISFIDSDDAWANDKLEKQIDFMEKNNLNFTYTDYTSFFEKNGKRKNEKNTSIKDSFDFKSFIKNSSINTTTMIISRSILGSHRFKKIKLCEDYLFKCNLLKKNIAKKLNENLAYYRISRESRSSKRLKNLYWLWYINKNYNKLSFVENLISVSFISINSIKKYGLK